MTKEIDIHRCVCPKCGHIGRLFSCVGPNGVYCPTCKKKFKKKDITNTYVGERVTISIEPMEE